MLFQFITCFLYCKSSTYLFLKFNKTEADIKKKMKSIHYINLEVTTVNILVSIFQSFKFFNCFY